MPPKVTIEHYLNKKIKPVPCSSGKFYPLYLQIQSNGKTVRIKSNLSRYLKIYNGPLERMTNGDKELALLMNSGLFSESWLKKITHEKRFPVFHLMADEISVLKKVIRLRYNKKENTVFSDIGRMYENCVKEITDVFDDFIKSAFQEELKVLFLHSIDAVEKKELFRLVNYFIHFINWNHPFYNIYDSTCELMPCEMKKIERHLSKELRLSIKAYTAYHTYINPLNRFFEKREQGRIATLSLLDWQSDIKSLLTKQFELIFGKKVALQYTRRLDDILNQCLGCRD
ncbi:MAG: hypothetical protein JXR41_15250 [Bacteroidales bacterium]|nr:hypothetical protein [Bacteroidales bacterium]MBN2764449.1 hypothetical protein [Bacteroidales bacterium]